MSIGNSGARSSGPTGSPVPGWSGGCGGFGMSAAMLYQCRGISLSGSWILVSLMIVLSPSWGSPRILRPT